MNKKINSCLNVALCFQVIITCFSTRLSIESVGKWLGEILINNKKNIKSIICFFFEINSNFM